MGCGDSVDEDGSVALHEEDGEWVQLSLSSLPVCLGAAWNNSVSWNKSMNKV